MKIKLDENMPGEFLLLLKSTGYEVSTVFEENLSGADDNSIYGRVSGEQKLLFTFDVDFADIHHPTASG